MSRDAFSLIELLVVIIIILILFGLTMSLAGPVRAQLMARKTAASMQSVLGMMHQKTAEFGGTVMVAEHPLAGSRPPRSAFSRRDGTAVQVSGEALVGIGLDQLSDAGSAGGRLLQADDVFSDPLSPLLFGALRSRLGILGAPRREVTAYRRLTAVTSGGMVASNARGSFVVDPDAGTPEHERALALTLGDEGVRALRADGILWTAPADVPSAVDGRIWVGDCPVTASRPGSRVQLGGVETPYRIHGSALYDAWGRELFFESLSGGQIRILSAGRDGFLQWNPGNDGVLQSSIDSVAGDDRDATSDNIASLTESRP